MFEEAQGPEVKRQTARSKDLPTKFNWKMYPVDELITFRDEITRVLPPLALSEMNLEEEMLLQFHSLRALQTLVLNDDDEVLNQRVQLANAVSNTLGKLIEQQAEVYSQERFKAIEALMIRHLGRLPEADALAFITDYEKALEGLK